MWRITSAERFNATLREIECEWSIDDLLDAHSVLDALDKGHRDHSDKNTPKARRR